MNTDRAGLHEYYQGLRKLKQSGRQAGRQAGRQTGKTKERLPGQCNRISARAGKNRVRGLEIRKNAGQEIRKIARAV